MNKDNISLKEYFEEVYKKFLKKSASEFVEEFSEDWKNDCTVDAITLLEKLENLSHISHKWAKRVFDQKVFLIKLEEIRETLYQKVIDLKIENGSLNDRDRLKTLSSKSQREVVKNEKIITIIDRHFKEHQFLLEYLESVVGDAKYILPKTCENSIELKKLEFMT